jgi:hypothetical protein
LGVRPRQIARGLLKQFVGGWEDRELRALVVVHVMNSERGKNGEDTRV